MFRILTTAACAVLLVSCVSCSLEDPPANYPPDSAPVSQLPEVEAPALPEAVATRVKATYADEYNIPAQQVDILRFSREIWKDGCLGLGGPAESCLLALTEGWQVETVDATTGNKTPERDTCKNAHIGLNTLV